MNVDQQLNEILRDVHMWIIKLKEGVRLINRIITLRYKPSSI